MLGLAGGHLDALAVIVGVFVATSIVACLVHRWILAFVYSLCLIASVAALGVHVAALLDNAHATAQLPLGLPLTGLRFRLDALGALFGVIVNIGIAAASLYGLGLDRRSELTARVEPFI